MKSQKDAVKKITAYIENHLEEEISLEKIAGQIGYSKFHLNRIFTKETGGTIHKYLQARRLTLAAEKLVKTDQPIAQIAFESGYQSQQAFTFAFKQAYLCSPRIYRNKRIYIQDALASRYTCQEPKWDKMFLCIYSCTDMHHLFHDGIEVIAA